MHVCILSNIHLQDNTLISSTNTVLCQLHYYNYIDWYLNCYIIFFPYTEADLIQLYWKNYR